MLTDRGTEYNGKPEHHEYELYLQLEGIDHSKTQVRHPQSNGICERLHRTMKDEFYCNPPAKYIFPVSARSHRLAAKKVMGENLSQKSRKFRSRAEILELISQQELSGLSVKAFCRSNSLSESSFNNWMRRYKNKGVRPEGSFAAVYVQPTPGGALFAEIRGIKIYQPVSAGFLKELAS